MLVISVLWSRNRVGALESTPGKLMSGPRLTAGSQAKSSSGSLRNETQICAVPGDAGGRLLLKNSQCPSGEMSGAISLLVLLMFGPRFWGGPHASPRLARCETQLSLPPRPPRRPEVMYRLGPFGEIAGWKSSAPGFTA